MKGIKTVGEGRVVPQPIVDSAMTFTEAVDGTWAPAAVVDALCLLVVRYYAFDGLLHEGQLVVHRDVREDIQAVFALVEQRRFPIAKVIPIVRYGWSDDASMADNNTSSFNYRTVARTERLSRHALGLAVDINPLQNPVLYPGGETEPLGATYRYGAPGVLTEDSPIVQEFLNRGWRWGGNFHSFKDYHHFER
ncbi:MAG: M15 family metallopeptidase [Syntrophales bacterium]|nr:M15 family metallopeptidase [Syntrophales bacterium]